MFSVIKNRTTELWKDQIGSIVSIELLLVAVMATIGILIGVTSMRDAIVSELSDVAGVVQDSNQSLTYNGVTAASASTAGTDFRDNTDVFDSSEDPAGIADNCILFDVLPSDETETAALVLSDVGTLTFDNVNRGVGGSASGTIGDATISTGFTITTDTGNIVGTTGGNELRFRETPTNSGSFSITFDDPLTEFEFWVRSMVNIAGEIENLLGNFVLVLSDNTVINDAPFQILPDVIAPNQTYGEFSTRGTDRSRVSAVTRNGNSYITDPAADGTPNQAAGRLTFPAVPSVGNPPAAGAVGLKSLTFERSGGASNNGFQSTFSTSGRVISQSPP